MRFIFFFLIASICSANPLETLSTQQQFNNYLVESHFNGLLFVKRGDQVLFKEAIGVRDFNTHTALTLEDKFQIGSITKQFVAAAILKLQDDAKLSIDDRVSKFLPDFPFLNQVTLRDILNHTSGIKNYTEVKSFWNLFFAQREIVSLDDIIHLLSPLPFDFAPRSQWSYSNSGYAVAGRVLEAVSHQSWDRYIQNTLLSRLGMTHTGYAPTFANVSGVLGYVLLNDRLTAAQPMNLSWAQSAGALYSTIDDLDLWTKTYSDSTLLSAPAKNEMQIPFLNHYALGLEVEDYHGDIKISHNGRTPGYATDLVYLKNSKLKIVKFDNIDSSMTDTTSAALDFYALGKAVVIKIAPFPLDPQRYVDYVGRYAMNDKYFDVSVKDGKLWLQLFNPSVKTQQRPYELYPTDIDGFRVENLAAEEFLRATDGKISKVRHFQSGIFSDWARIQ